MNEEIGLAIVMLLVGAVATCILGLLVWSLVWVYRDAEARGKTGWAVAFAVLILKWPISLLLWLIFRPGYLTANQKNPI